jgi:hypothetical protein
MEWIMMGIGNISLGWNSRRLMWHGGLQKCLFGSGIMNGWMVRHLRIIKIRIFV